MICRNCQWGGELATQASVIWQPLWGESQATVPGTEVARKMHERCKGGTWCDCQHKLPVRSGGADPTLNK